MTIAVRKFVAYVLIALLAIISGIGEGLHWIPGCGHGVAIGDAVLLLGISVPDVPRPDDGRTCIGDREGPRIPVYDEDQCAICSAVGQNCTSVDSPPAILVLQLMQELAPVVHTIAPAIPARSFQARDPPLI